MTTDLHRGPAKIYQFPTRSRPALGGSRPGENPAAANPPPHVVAACGSAWYHEEAIRDAGLAGKN
jgi:hypothetical protein